LTVGEKSDDQFPLDVLGSILAGPRTARLTKALVYDQQAAATLSVDQNTNEDVGEFSVVATPRPGHSLTELEAAVDAVVEKLKAEGPTAEEVQNAINAVTKADLVRVAKQYIDLEHLSIVIVGDRATIEGPLKATGIAPIVGLDIEGNRK
jgi:predicted Zn-dependent peptidase